MILKMSKYIVLLWVCFLTSCSTKPSYIKMHPNESLPTSQVALLKPVAYVKINEIDSKETSIEPHGQWGTTEYEIELLPGNHVLKLSYSSGTEHSLSDYEMSISLEANRKYILKPGKSSKRESWWKSPDVSWKPELVDVTGKDECWTISVGTLIGPKGC